MSMTLVYEISKKGRKQIGGCLGQGQEQGLTINSHEGFYWDDRNVLKTGLC